MAGELQALNFITSHIERLPLNDSGNEKLPSVFYYQESSDKNLKALKANKISGQVRDNSHSRSFCEPRSNLNENCRAIFDGYHECKTKNSLTIYELTKKLEPIFASEDAATCAKLRDERSSLSTIKRKRSTDSNMGEPSKSLCDEEISKICDKRTFRSFRVHLGQEFQRNHDEFMHNLSPRLKRKSLCKSQPEQKRPKPCSGVHVTKKRSATPWLPFEFRCAARKMKMIRVKPLNPQEKDICRFYGERFSEERFFRPIGQDE